MLHLKTAAGERLEIPPSCLIAVMQPCNDVNPSAVVYDVGAGPQVDQLTDPYGMVKKLAIDVLAITNPIEARILEPVVGGDSAELREGRLFCARSRIAGRREVLTGDTPVRAILFVDLFGKMMSVRVADTLDELDGVEPLPAPVTTAPEGA